MKCWGSVLGGTLYSLIITWAVCFRGGYRSKLTPSLVNTHRFGSGTLAAPQGFSGTWTRFWVVFSPFFNIKVFFSGLFNGFWCFWWCFAWFVTKHLEIISCCWEGRTGPWGELMKAPGKPFQSFGFENVTKTCSLWSLWFVGRKHRHFDKDF